MPFPAYSPASFYPVSAEAGLMTEERRNLFKSTASMPVMARVRSHLYIGKSMDREYEDEQMIKSVALRSGCFEYLSIIYGIMPGFYGATQQWTAK
jgi:hypothetical protein